ncbi:MAG: hypothetical protein ACRDZX_05835 [Acidimicrobiales bacterium]
MKIVSIPRRSGGHYPAKFGSPACGYARNIDAERIGKTELSLLGLLGEALTQLG